MEKERSGFLSPSRENGAALVVVLLAIAILLPPTLVLASLAVRWQRQSIDFRDSLGEELAARGAFEQARARLSGDGLDLSPNEGTSFVPRPVEGLLTSVRVSRSEDVVLTLDGRVLEGIAARSADLTLMGTDPEGRAVYQYRKVEIYLVEVNVSRRPSLAPVQLYGVLGRLPDGNLQVLGLTRKRVFPAQSSGKSGENQKRAKRT
ncbi:MAG: hypothetical protein ACRD3V_26450 [Vicinamibacteria bacterium]